MIEPLLPIKLPPGMYRNGTKYEAKNRWYNGNLVRFYSGAIRPVQGWRVSFDANNNPMPALAGVPRAAFAWRSAAGVPLIAVGTTEKLYVIKDGTAYDITPVDFVSGTSGSTSGVRATGTLTSDATNVAANETVTIGSITYTFKASPSAANEVKVGADAATSLANLKKAINATGTAGTEYGTGTVANTSVEALTLTSTTLALRARVAGSTGNTLATTETSAHLSFGATTLTGGAGGSGDYGSGLYGASLYGIGKQPLAQNITDADTWQLDAFGDVLVACCTAGGRIYVWTGNTASPATVAGGASPESNRGVVITPERFVMAVGASADVRLVFWASQATSDDWDTASTTNSAGDFTLVTQGRIMCARRTPAQTLIFTDADVHSATYVGGDVIYSFKQEGDNCGIVSPQAVAIVDTTAMWMGKDNFYGYDGFVKPIPCDVHDYVFDDFNAAQASKVFATPVSEFGEVWWFYPSSGSDEPDRYVVYNYREQHWTTGTLSRTCAIDRGALPNPVMFDSFGTIYTHELPAGGDRTVPLSTYFSDTLVDVDTTLLSAHTPSGTQPNAFGWVKITGDTLVFNGTTQVKKSAASEPLYETDTDLPVLAYELSCDVTVPSGPYAADEFIGIMGRGDGSTVAGVYFGIETTTPLLKMYELNAAGAVQWTESVNLPTGFVGTTVTLKMTATLLGEFAGYVNNTQMLSHTSATLTGKRVGLCGSSEGLAGSTPDASDNFTEADGTAITASTPSSGTWSQWGNSATYTSTIVSNQAKFAKSGGTRESYLWSVSPASDDYTVQADVTPLENGSGNMAGLTGVVARATVAVGGYAAVLSPVAGSGGSVALYKMTAAGLVTGGVSLGSATVGTVTGTAYRIALKCVGTSLKVFVDGVLKISVTDATYASGSVGFTGEGGISFGANNLLDNWELFYVAADGSDLFFEGDFLVRVASTSVAVLEASGGTTFNAVGEEVLVPFLESGPFEMGAGDRVVRVQRIVPDEKNLGDVQMRFYTAMFPTETEVAHGPYSMANPTAVRFTGRQFRMRIEEVNSVNWRVGVTRLGVIAEGKR